MKTQFLYLWILITSVAILVSACGMFDRNGDDDDLPEFTGLPGLNLTTDAFDDGAEIPTLFTCDGENVSPPLEWNLLPEGTASLVLIVDDPDAPRGTVTHWLMYNIPPDVMSLPQNVEPLDRLENGAMQGATRDDQIGYRGPCPPQGEEHGYRFTLLALNSMTELGPGADRAELIEAVDGRVVAGSQIIGRYQRP